MAFIRSKQIHGHTYYYLVANQRINGESRQRVLKYLGKQKESSA